jgi:chromate reductase, NAD(P)H dehydrogenase (quinone)
MRILAVSGSLRDASYNTMLLRAAVELAPDGVELELWDGLNAIAGADAVLFATPEYNSSVPGQLKNAIDWASRPKATAPLRNKLVAVVGASTGMFGAVWAQAELRKVLASAGARVLESELPVGTAHTRFDEAGRLVDDEVRERLAGVVRSLADAAVREPVAA